MKKTFKFVAIIAAAFAAIACAKDIDAPVENPSVDSSADTFTATIESVTKTSIGADDHTVWSAGDALNVFETTEKSHKYVLSAGQGTNTATFKAENEAAETKLAALYPYHEEHAYDGTTFTVNVPAEHAYVEGELNMTPMVGTFADGKVTFKNAGALIRVEAKNIPAGYNQAVLTSADVNLSGEMTINKSANLIAGTYNEANNSVAITWEAGSEVADKVFYFPVPVAKFAKLTVTLTNGTESYLVKERANITTKRNTCYRMTSDAEEIFICTEQDLFDFAERVAAGNTYDGQEVKLADDITMTQPWTPIGNLTDGIAKSFRGTFDGQGYTIKDLKVTSAENAGFFGAKWDGDVKNVKFDNATISGHHYAGVVVGWADGNNYNSFFSIDACEVTNSTVTLTPELIGESYDNGDKAGAIIGYAYAIKVTNNTVANTTITGYRDLGGIVGCTNEAGDKFSTIAGNTVGENVKVIVDNSHNYKNYTENASYNIASYCGRPSANTVLAENTGEAELVYPKTIYLVPNENWNQADARFAVYAFRDDNNKVWYDMTESDQDGVYEVAISAIYTTVIYVRMNPETTENNWDNKWNQTNDMKLDDSKPYCIIPWDVWDGSHVWSNDGKSFDTDGKYYLQPNENWKQSDARFAVYFFNNNNNTNAWVGMTQFSSNPAYYEVSIPDGEWLNLIFCRMNPTAPENKWDNRWNQSGDLTIPTNGNNLFTVPDGDWDGSTGNWSTK